MVSTYETRYTQYRRFSSLLLPNTFKCYLRRVVIVLLLFPFKQKPIQRLVPARRGIMHYDIESLVPLTEQLFSKHQLWPLPHKEGYLHAKLIML